MSLKTIALPGEVIEWDESRTDHRQITAAERDEFESRGYVVMELAGQVSATKILPWEDGTIECQPKSTMRARWAIAGRHTNAGYDGYFKLYVWEGGKRRTMVDAWTLFPNNEHHYAKQAEKSDAFERIVAIVSAKKGSLLEKVKGGWRLCP